MTNGRMPAHLPMIMDGSFKSQHNEFFQKHKHNRHKLITLYLDTGTLKHHHNRTKSQIHKHIIEPLLGSGSGESLIPLDMHPKWTTFEKLEFLHARTRSAAVLTCLLLISTGSLRQRCIQCHISLPEGRWSSVTLMLGPMVVEGENKSGNGDGDYMECEDNNMETTENRMK